MNEEQKEEFKAGLAKEKETKIAEKKIKFVKDLLPPILITEGLYPLQILHEELSTGIQGKTDDECLFSAEILRETMSNFIYLLMVTKNKK